jgi:predicted transcriptional regulator
MRMTLKLLLVKGEKVLAEVPLVVGDEENREFLEKEIDELGKHEFKELSGIFDMLSNQDRLKMLSKMLTSEGPVRFVDFMNDLELNQKLVSDYCRRMMESGLVTCRERGKYEASPQGSSSFMVAMVALKKILEVLEDEMSD